MKETAGADELIGRAAELLDRSVERTAPDDLARLRQARERALSAHPARLPVQPWPAAGLAALATVAVLALALRVLVPSSGPEPVPGLQHLELLASADGLEFYEDLEFIQWLEGSRE
jgi:hypothetical protein